MRKSYEEKSCIKRKNRGLAFCVRIVLCAWLFGVRVFGVRVGGGMVQRTSGARELRTGTTRELGPEPEWWALVLDVPKG